MSDSHLLDRDPTGRPAPWVRRLGAAVLRCALRDAARPRARDAAGWGRTARDWIDARDENFRHWSSCVGVEPAELARRLQGIVARGLVSEVLAAADPERPSPRPRDDDRDDEADEW